MAASKSKSSNSFTETARPLVPPLFVSRVEACRLLGKICLKTLENQFLKTNRLRVVKIGRRSVIRYADLQRLARER